MSDYLEQRLEPEIQWYDRKSIASKRLFYIFRIATIVISACLIFMGYFSALSGWLVGLIGILIIDNGGSLSLVRKLCHNICVVIQEMYELGISAKF